MVTSIEVSDFISCLNNYRSEGTFNPWSETDKNLDLIEDAWINRQMNLHDHLMCDARYILVGEAPGYQGCRYTGIPFTSERLIYEGETPRLEYARKIRITNRQRPWSEPSATIVWGALKDLGIENDTVLWNAYPFHPYRLGNPMSNRAPSLRELNDGIGFMAEIISFYKEATVIAVGNSAYSSLSDNLGMDIQKVRHPANGGATKFKDQLNNILIGERAIKTFRKVI